jgi:gas vesicle protein
MKKNKGLLIAFAAGAAAAGVAAWWLNSKKGKSATDKLKLKGEKMIDEAEDILSEARGRFENLRSDMFRKEKKNEKVTDKVVM